MAVHLFPSVCTEEARFSVAPMVRSRYLLNVRCHEAPIVGEKPGV